MSEIVEPAPAKINLTLRVLGRRPDGFHEIESIVVFADIADRIVLRRRGAAAASTGPASLTITGPYARAISGVNLVEAAIELVEQAAGRPLPADVELDKHLPVASGIGGGSVDAAAALRAIRTAFPDLAARLDWPGLALRLGSDVPVCLAGRPALMTGRGEHLRPLHLPSLDIVLTNAGCAVPADKTRRVFEALDAPPVSGSGRPLLTSAITRADLLRLVAETGNDLEAPATRVLAQVTSVKSAVAATPACEIAMLSGAGPTVVGVYPSASAARNAARLLQQAHPSWWVKAGATAAA